MTQPLTQRVNWKHVSLFIGITFALTWLLDLFLELVGGYGSGATMALLQFQMLIPAAVAIALSMWVFAESPIFFRNDIGKARVFFYVYLAFTIVYMILGLAGALVSSLLTTISIVTGILSILSLLFIIVWRFVAGRESYQRAGLSFGKPKYWVLFSLGLLLFYLLQDGLNALFKLGKPVDISLLAISTGLPLSPAMFFIVAFIQTVVVGPLIGLIFGFGEEYGWRGYLQSELAKLGKRRGILLLGVIWGVWHFPIIWMGHNYPGHPVLGSLLMTIYTIALAFIFGYAVFKSGSVWLAAYLHALNNQFIAFLMSLVYTPNDTTIAFGIGAFGIIPFAIAILLILRDPLWREPLPEPQPLEPAPISE